MPKTAAAQYSVECTRRTRGGSNLVLEPSHCDARDQGASRPSGDGRTRIIRTWPSLIPSASTMHPHPPSSSQVVKPLSTPLGSPVWLQQDYLNTNWSITCLVFMIPWCALLMFSSFHRYVFVSLGTVLTLVMYYAGVLFWEVRLKCFVLVRRVYLVCSFFLVQQRSQDSSHPLA